MEMKPTQKGTVYLTRVFVLRGKCQPEPKGKKKKKEAEKEKINSGHHCSFLKHLTTNHYAVSAID